MYQVTLGCHELVRCFQPSCDASAGSALRTVSLRLANLFGDLLASITDPNGNTITLTRNPSAPQQITAINDPVGRQLTITWDSTSPGRITTITDPIGRQVTYAYNAGGQLATYTDAAGGITQYAWDASGNLTSVTDPRGVVTEQNTYDANGRAIKRHSGSMR